MEWLFLDSLVRCEPGKSVEAVKCFSALDPIFKEHFPGFPTVPGALQIEMIAQAGGKCIRLARPSILPILGTLKSAKFFRRIQPEEECRILVEIFNLRTAFATAFGRIEVAGTKAAEAEILFALIPSSQLDENHRDLIMEKWEDSMRGKDERNHLDK